MKSPYVWQGSKVQQSGSDRCQRFNSSLAPLAPWVLFLRGQLRNNLPCGKAKPRAWHSVANPSYLNLCRMQRRSQRRGMEARGGRVGWGITMDIRGHSLIACFIYFLMLMRAEYRRSAGFLRSAGEETQRGLRPPLQILQMFAGGGGGGVVECVARVSSRSSCLQLHSGLIFNEDCTRTGTSLKRAILRLSCLPLNLTADLSHYLFPQI